MRYLTAEKGYRGSLILSDAAGQSSGPFHAAMTSSSPMHLSVLHYRLCGFGKHTHPPTHTPSSSRLMHARPLIHAVVRQQNVNFT